MKSHLIDELDTWHGLLYIKVYFYRLYFYYVRLRAPYIFDVSFDPIALV